MNTYPSLTNVRSHLSDIFARIQAQALRGLLWARLTGAHTRLEVFPEQAPQKSPNRTFIRSTEIPVGEIVGTLNRQADFDHKFRPLKSYLRDRWVNAYLAFEREGWAPILVHKVGDRYFVEDGHHRVSVARSLGIAFIEARVWEYPLQIKPSKACQPAPCPEVGSATVYAGMTD